MDVTFRTKKLRRYFEDSAGGIRALGPEVAKRYVLRINTIKGARDIEELKRLPALRCHPLHGDREGQWAIHLTKFMRLIFTLTGESANVVRIEEVSKHYGD